MHLYPHNQQAYDKAVEIFRHHNRTCIIHPTGTGKAVIIAQFILSNPNARHLLLAPGEHIAAEVAKHTGNAQFSFRTYLSLSYPQEPSRGLDYIYLDEFHRVGAEKWGPGVLRLLAANPNARVLGTTATHIRFLDDHRDMAIELFRENIASYLSLNRSFLEGILRAPRYVSAIYSISMEYRRVEDRIRRSQHQEKERLLKDLKARVIDWEKSSGLDIILRKHLPPSRKKIIVFCASLKEMSMAEEILTPTLTSIFGNLLSLSIHTEFGKPLNTRRLAQFNEDDNLTKVLFTVNMVTEGLHGKDISTVILLRETSSPIIWYQQIGRCFSVGQKEQPIIFDLVNNFRYIQYTRFKADFEEEKAMLGDKTTTKLQTQLDKKGTPIEFIDETQGIQQILTTFESQVDEWVVGYMKAKAFFDRYGHLKVTTRQDRKLLQWIAMQRIGRRANRLSADKIDLLTKIGIDWQNSRPEGWRKKFLQLKKVIEEHGHIPLKYKFLADWLRIQRIKQEQNKLKEEQRQLLEQIVSLEKSRATAWTNKLRKVEEYFLKHKTFYKKKGESIQKDVEMIRAAHRKGKLPEFVFTRLSQLNFRFDYVREKYLTCEEALEQYVEFTRQHGKRPTCSTNLYLQQWYTKQCTKYRRGLMKIEEIELFKKQELATGLKLLPTLIIPKDQQSRRA